MVMRAEIWLVNFDKAVGGVKHESRPYVIVSPDEMNEHLDTVLAAPMSTGDLAAPFRVAVDFMKKEGLILLDQTCVLDKARLIRKLGSVTDKTMTETLDVLQEIFAQ